ncbi:DUF1566 domain-containing protein [candidate division KSB3 bacterium]|uniref:DUF1566 domain-containing protein n=1 Tax=candidate division KSB3 bacterium TaxID=2044937 RepID=A0A9D5JYT4_9BACT|nr:DUF1566 domain-containing protein [candidate division KSB3 bacterium]
MQKLRGGIIIGLLIAIIVVAGCNSDTNGITFGSAKSSSAGIVDTGQRTCYDAWDAISCPSSGQAFAGQDAQYAGAQPAYQDNGDGTVTDLNTGLMWQKTPGEKMTYDEAVAHASSFDLAGYTDWRLPTIKELYSLILFSGIDVSGPAGAGASPFIATDYFDFEYGDVSAGERIIDVQYLSATEYVGYSNTFGGLVFGVNFADGRIKGYPRRNKTFVVQYVRGTSTYGMNSFVDNGDGTVRDLATGLTWQQADDGVTRNWEEALAYCEDLTLADSSNWRLPNAKELQSIVDYTSNYPALDTSVFTQQDPGGWFWSSTTHVGMNGSFAAYVCFGPCTSANGDDVHGAGAQRSDPKSGDPAAWAGGHGPQNDEIRIYNYARCVR